MLVSELLTGEIPAAGKTGGRQNRRTAKTGGRRRQLPADCRRNKNFLKFFQNKFQLYNFFTKMLEIAYTFRKITTKVTFEI